ncbi:hypothetical protein MJO29_000271 [Puccinia striiformis f. sp. tritici]|nr:hypothetical protein MJO29_000271 [Puccinia striiformis f. sp. tritici]
MQLVDGRCGMVTVSPTFYNCSLGVGRHIHIRSPGSRVRLPSTESIKGVFGITAMIHLIFVLIAVTSLLAARTQGAQTPNKVDPTTCFSDMKVIGADCTAATGGIIYRAQTQAGKVLASGETTVQSIHGNCNVQIYKPSTAMISESQIKSSVDKILTSCLPQAGSTKFTITGNEVTIKLVNRAPKGSWQEPYDPDFPLDKPACLAVAGTKPIDQADCAHAARALPTIGDYGSIGNSSSRSEVVAQFKTCQLKVSTSDGSAIIAKIPDLDVPLLQLHECLENWGVVGIKGASGPNGRTYVQVTSV